MSPLRCLLQDLQKERLREKRKGHRPWRNLGEKQPMRPDDKLESRKQLGTIRFLPAQGLVTKPCSGLRADSVVLAKLHQVSQRHL